MSKKFGTLSVVILLFALLAVSIQPAISATTIPNTPPPSTITLNLTKGLDPIDNSTLPDVSLFPIQTFEEQQLFWTFLTDIAGLDTNNYNIDFFIATPEEVTGSQKTQTSISAILSNRQATLNIAMVIIEGKVRFYDLNLATGTLEKPTTTTKITDSLSASRSALTQYQTSFNAEYCADFAELIPVALESEMLSVDSGNLLLTVERSTDELKQIDYTHLCWYQKIGDFASPWLSIQATFAETGLLTSFADNRGLYHVATTEVVLTEQDALELASLFIVEYADANGRTVESIGAEFVYVSDYSSARGDSYLVYPQWTVTALFDDSNLEGIYGYNVLIWGDSGEVHYHGIKGLYQSIQSTAEFSYQYAIIIALTMTVSIIGAVVYVRAKNPTLKPKYFALKTGGILMAMSLCAMMFVQPAIAIPATILGSSNDIDITELGVATAFSATLYGWCSSAGYSPVYNWYGSSTTIGNIYDAANDHGTTNSLVFYIGHGDNGTKSGAGYAISDDTGYWATATSILSNSSDGHNKFANIWSCYQGNPTSTMINAWLHTTPSAYCGQAFISWEGPAPYLSDNIAGTVWTGNWFLREFYDRALNSHYDLQSSLDYAAQQIWGVNFNNSPFGNGSIGRTLRLYGQGSLHIGNITYADNIMYSDYGYSIASGLFDIDNLLGPQIDNKYARLYAGNYPDFAYIETQLNQQTSGNLHIRAYSVPAYFSHFRVYVSTTGTGGWITVYDNTQFTESSPVDINCGWVSNIRYVAVAVIDDTGCSGNVCIDTIQVI
jgi:hypothetical protein